MRGWLVSDIFSCELKDFSMKSHQHTIAYVKRQAKKIKRERGISHAEALDIVSKSFGFSNWMHCQRSLSKINDSTETVSTPVELSFTDWLKRHSNRDSPLGDLARDMSRDKSWPTYNSLDEYRSYLRFQNAYYGAIETLNRAWKRYKAYLKTKENPTKDTTTPKKPSRKNYDERKIVYVKNVTSIHFSKRTVEEFVPGDRAWVSWDGRKAIPVTITGVDDRYYSFKTERPLNKASGGYFLFLDEVRSTPELACINCRTS